MRETGRSTRLFQAIVAMGLGAAAAGCGGQTASRDRGGLADAADDAAPLADAPADAPGLILLLGGQDASFSSADAGDAADASTDQWFPPPPPIV